MEIIVVIILGAFYDSNGVNHLNIIKNTIYPIVHVKNNNFGINLQLNPNHSLWYKKFNPLKNIPNNIWQNAIIILNFILNESLNSKL